MAEFGEMAPIEDVHHIVPRSLWGWTSEGKHDPKNLIGVCRNCHSNHRPHIESKEMIRYLLGQMHDRYGYEYWEERYRPWAYEMYEERGIEYVSLAHRLNLESTGSS